MSDFDNWYQWAVRHFGPFDREIGVKLYNEFYNCNCQSCEYRKEHGLMPVHQGEGCTLPTSLRPLEQALSAVVTAPKRDGQSNE